MVAKKGSKGTEKTRDGPEVDMQKSKAERYRRKNSQRAIGNNASFILWLHHLD